MQLFYENFCHFFMLNDLCLGKINNNFKSFTLSKVKQKKIYK